MPNQGLFVQNLQVHIEDITSIDATKRDVWQKMRFQTRSTNESAIWVFSPLFLAAIGFAVTLRILEIYLSVTTTIAGMVTLWRGATIGDLGLADLGCLIACAFVIVAILDALRSPKSIGGWMALGFCMLLAVYTASIYHFTETLVDLGFPVESSEKP